VTASFCVSCPDLDTQVSLVYRQIHCQQSKDDVRFQVLIPLLPAAVHGVRGPGKTTIFALLFIFHLACIHPRCAAHNRDT